MAIQTTPGVVYVLIISEIARKLLAIFLQISFRSVGSPFVDERLAGHDSAQVLLEKLGHPALVRGRAAGAVRGDEYVGHVP